MQVRARPLETLAFIIISNNISLNFALGYVEVLTVPDVDMFQ